MLAVTGIGMVSPLGLDAVTSCAAARAGLRRAEELDDFFQAEEEGGEPVPIVGHRVPLVAHGLFGFARLAQIAAAGLDDLKSRTPRLGEGRLGFILLAGSAVYSAAAIEQARNSPDTDPLELESLVAREKALDERITEALLATIVRRSALSVEPSLRATIRSTCVGLVPALVQAQEWLSSRACDRCVIGAVDSLVDPSTLEALLDLRMVKTAAIPVGMIPGEAAAFFVLEPARGVTARGSEVGALLVAQTTATGRPSFASNGTQADGEGAFAGAVAQTLATSAGEPFRGPLVTNLNGDEHRARVWSDMLLRLRPTNDITGVPVWLPCLAFGDTGAATGCISIAMLAHAWARRYSPAPRALVCLQDDAGGRAVIAVRAPSS